jgi:hypothetical protein
MIIDLSDSAAVLGGLCILAGLVCLGVPGFLILAGFALSGVGLFSAARKASRSSKDSK